MAPKKTPTDNSEKPAVASKAKSAKAKDTGKNTGENSTENQATPKKAAAKKTQTKTSAAKEKDKASKKEPASNTSAGSTAAETTSTTQQGNTGSSTMSEAATADVAKESQAKKSHQLIRGKFNQYAPASDEDYMSPAQLEHFKIILNDWKTELMNEVDRTVDHMKDESANLPDPADRATQEEEFSLELRTRDRERKLIKKIDKTLEAIENDEYGFCEDCGIEIGLRRLEARPTATLCIDCKTLAEIKEKQYRN